MNSVSARREKSTRSPFPSGAGERPSTTTAETTTAEATAATAGGEGINGPATPSKAPSSEPAAAPTPDTEARDRLMHGCEHEASAVALFAAAVGDYFGNPVKCPAAFAADAMQWLADDMAILAVAESNGVEQLNEDTLDMAHRRLELRTQALAEMVRRLADHGTIEPMPAKQ